MLKKRGIFLIALLVMSLLVFSACSGDKEKPQEQAQENRQQVDEEVIKIGIFEPITGANGAGGAMEEEGVRLANKLYPEVLGKKVELVLADNKSDKVEAANAAIRLVEQEKVNAIIGSWGSSLSMAAGSIVKDAQVPAVAASATNPLVTLGNDYYFRVCFLDPFQGDVLARYAAEKLGAKKVAIIKEVSNDYAVGLAKFFSDAFIKYTGDENAIVAEVNYQTGDQEFSAQIQAVAKENPDVIFAPGNYTESALIIKQAREQGIDTPFLGGDTWETPEFLQIGGEAVEGVVISTFFSQDFPITEESKVFLDAYAEHGQFDEPAAVTALAYDAYLVILDAIERAGSADPVAIRDALAETKDFEGATGYISFDENGDAVKDVVMKVVKDNKFVYLDTISPNN